jgi:hypothetical protein
LSPLKRFCKYKLCVVGTGVDFHRVREIENAFFGTEKRKVMDYGKITDITEDGFYEIDYSHKRRLSEIHFTVPFYWKNWKFNCKIGLHFLHQPEAIRVSNP